MKGIVLALLLLPVVTTGQTKKLTFDDVYKNSTFRSENIAGFRSMNDGRYYVETTETGVLKKDFVTGKTIETLIKSADIKDEKGETSSS
jgi:hypothetical protein